VREHRLQRWMQGWMTSPAWVCCGNEDSHALYAGIFTLAMLGYALNRLSL
jgi:hypothetical protein